MLKASVHPRCALALEILLQIFEPLASPCELVRKACGDRNVVAKRLVNDAAGIACMTATATSSNANPHNRPATALPFRPRPRRRDPDGKDIASNLESTEVDLECNGGYL